MIPKQLVQSTYSTLKRNCPTGGAWLQYSHIPQAPQPSRERLRERPRGFRPTSGQSIYNRILSSLGQPQAPTNLETHCALISLICQNDPAWPGHAKVWPKSLASCTDRKNRKTKVHGSRTSFWSPSNSALYGVLRFTAYCGHYMSLPVRIVYSKHFSHEPSN